MTLDQKIQVWVAVGTWVSSIATIFAVITALYLARKVEKVRLRTTAGLRELYMGDGSPAEKHISIDATNLGERPITILSVGWRIGKGKARKFCIQVQGATYSSICPIELAYGKGANFMVSFNLTPNWLKDFAVDFIHDLSEKNLKTLVAQVHTSVGETVDVKVETNLLDALRKFRPQPLG